MAALQRRQGLASGELKLIAVLAPQRLPGKLSSVPTAREQGVDVVWATVRGIYMGPGVSARDHDEWSRTLGRILQRPEYARLLERYGLQPHPLTGAELDRYVAQEVARLKEVARGLHLRVR